MRLYNLLAHIKDYQQLHLIRNNKDIYNGTKYGLDNTYVIDKNIENNIKYSKVKTIDVEQKEKYIELKIELYNYIPYKKGKKGAE